MKQAKTTALAGAWCTLAAVIVFAALAGNNEAAIAPSRQTSSSVAQAVPVYVTDFEMFAFTADAPRTKNPREIAERKSPPVYLDDDTPPAQARRLTDYFAKTLVQTLNRSGYAVSRQRGKLPEKGLLLRGVFAEPDARNRIRRALLGGGSAGSEFMLYVGTFSLTNQDQPLYQMAPVQSPDPNYGPIITLNAYIPLAKYNMAKNPTEDEVQKICDAIASNLAALLSKNKEAFLR
jgi:hypothetical protein